MHEAGTDNQAQSDEPAWARRIGAPTSADPPPLSRESRIRRGIVASGLCLAAALPSFVMAVLGEYNVPALVTGVFIFAGAMIAISWTQEFRSFTRQQFVRRTLFFVYGVRILISAATPLLFVADALPGLLLSSFMNSLAVESGVNGIINFAPPEISGDPVHQPAWFFATLIMVLAQGILLNILLGVLFVAAWTAQAVILGRHKNTSTHHCARCRHSLEGLPKKTPCPECGWNDPEPPPSWIERVRIRTLVLLVLCVCALATASSATLLTYVD